MSLATRCPRCDTVFRVVRDQLRVSEGWVRCGRCNEVFNAGEALFDLDQELAGFDAHHDTATPVASAATTDSPEPRERHGEGRGPAAGPRSGQPGRPGTAIAARIEPAADLPPLPATDDGAPPESLLLRTRSEPAADEAIVITDHEPDSAPLRPTSSPTPAASALAADAPETPAFVRQAERAARWRQPAMRAVLGSATLALAALLALQAARLWRDPLAAHVPGLAGPLATLCRLSGCQVEPLRRIALLAVEASGLHKLADAAAGAVPGAGGAPLYRLSLQLHNRGDTVLLLPALELALTDAQGQLVGRRVFSAAELGTPQTTISPGQELPIQAVLATGGRRVDGYTVELFYP